MKEPESLTGIGIEARGLRADTIQFEPGEGAGVPTEVSLSLTDTSPEGQKKRDVLLLAARAGKIARLTLRDVTFSSDDPENERGYVFDENEFGPFIESFAGVPFRKDHDGSYDARGGTVLRAWAAPPDATGRRWAKCDIELDETWSLVGALTRKLDHFSFGTKKVQAVICTICNSDFLACSSHDVGRTYDGKKARMLCKGVRGSEISVVSNPAYAGTAVGHLLDIAADAGTKEIKGMELLKKLAKLCGLSEDATEEQVEEAITKKFAEVPAAPVAETGTVVASIATFCGLEATATETEIKAAIMGQQYRPDNDEDKAAIRELKAARRVDYWTKEKGKFTPAEREWAMAQALKDLNAFELYASKKEPAVPVGGPGGLTAVTPASEGIHADDKEEFGLDLTATDEPLDDHERAVLRSSKGYMKPEKWLQIRRSDAKQRRALAS